MEYGLPDSATNSKRLLSAKEAETLVDEAYEGGVRTFDTAHDYGLAEERLGAALQGSGKVWTKLGKLALEGARPANALAGLTTSLSRLRRSRIDVLQFHNWHSQLAHDAGFSNTWRALSEDDRCAELGASTYGPADALAAIESGFFTLVQIEWNLLNQVVLREVGSIARSKGVRLAARSVFLQGVLTDRGRELPPHLSELAAWRQRAQALATELGTDLSTLALRAAVEHPHLDHVLVGVDAPGQMRLHIAAAQRTQPALPWDAIADLHSDCKLTDPRRWAAK
jgi:aryl-alcohol dehydrogenase-like predicted oxidoreductase